MGRKASKNEGKKSGTKVINPMLAGEEDGEEADDVSVASQVQIDYNSREVQLQRKRQQKARAAAANQREAQFFRQRAKQHSAQQNTGEDGQPKRKGKRKLCCCAGR